MRHFSLIAPIMIHLCPFRYEKLISGKYLGEIVRQVLQDLIKSRSLFGGKSSEKLDTFEKFKTKYISYIEGGYVYQLE